MDNNQALSDIVKVTYKTGNYIGETIDRDDRRLLVKVLAVLQHPTQGDLHNPYEPEPPIFHERRALAYTEKVWVPAQTVQPYTGAIPAYGESLKTALGVEMERINRTKRWAERCLENLQGLQKDYGI